MSETKIDETFQSRQFYIEGFIPTYRFDRNCHGGGILVYVREDIPSKLIEMSGSVEGISIELNLRKKKWLVNCSYNANNSTICNHLRSLGKSLDTPLTNYYKVFLMGDFNAEASHIHIKDFSNVHKLKNLIKVPTCFKNPDNPKTTDLMLTNSVRSFQNSCALETGLFGFHKITVAVLKSYLEKKQPKIISCRNFGKFSNNDFRTQPLRDFSTLHLSSDSPSLDLYVGVYIRALDIYFSKKKKNLTANDNSFINKAISKAVMDRTRLRNKLLKNRSAENKLAYNRQRTYCVSLTRKSRRDYYNNLHNRNVTDNKLFWQTVTPFFCDKGPTRQKIALIEKDQI